MFSSSFCTFLSLVACHHQVVGCHPFHDPQKGISANLYVYASINLWTSSSRRVFLICKHIRHGLWCSIFLHPCRLSSMFRYSCSFPTRWSWCIRSSSFCSFLSSAPRCYPNHGRLSVHPLQYITEWTVCQPQFTNLLKKVFGCGRI